MTAPYDVRPLLPAQGFCRPGVRAVNPNSTGLVKILENLQRFITC